MPKKIFYVVPAFPVGGAEKFLITLANSMVNETSQQTVVSLSTNNKLQGELDRSINFKPIPRKHKFDIASVRSLRKINNREKPEVIFCLNFFSYFFTRLAMAGLRTKSSIYISYHTTIHINKKEHFLHKFYTSILTHRDHILFVSRNQEVTTVKKYHIPGRFYDTIINGIELTRWKLPDDCNSAIATRQLSEIPENVPVISM